MELEEFLEVLEGELFDELLIMIMEMDDTNEDVEDHSEDTYFDSPEYISSVYYDIPEEEVDSILDMLSEALNADDFFVIPQEPVFSTKKFGKPTNDEDAKVRRILDRYKDVG
jgi:hypothetical protein